ncbi:hypothetical protein [uncultured Roseobacter sp.]|uniref:hypothetical protein n=1 Tax=uncultured Roseobacter sp. TaxID=114847 RepID=UPI00262AF8BD|nr:hypothetical protein [uncultured Roseobacter sp.]
MQDQFSHDDSRFLSAFVRPAWIVMMVAQMLLGLALGITLIVKYYMLVVGASGCVADMETLGNLIRCTPTLTLVAHFVIAVAGFRFAAFMFADRPRALLGPLMVAFGGTLLLVLSDLRHGTATWAGAATIVTLMLGISAIFAAQVYLRGRSGPSEK